MSMIEGYGTFATSHVWLGIDPGITTGVAILTDNGDVVETWKLDATVVKRDLDELIRRIHRGGATIDVVKERLARVGSGSLAKTLEQVVHEVDETIIDVYDLPIHVVTPGQWKPSRVAKQMRPLLDKTLSAHEKDAACMAAYIMEKGTPPTVVPKSHARPHHGRKRLEDTPRRISQRLRDEKRREARKEARRAARANR